MKRLFVLVMSLIMVLSLAAPAFAAGGYTDGDTKETLREAGIVIDDVLKNNDAYHALKEAGGLIVTGPTGTNVNDVAVALLRE